MAHQAVNDSIGHLLVQICRAHRNKAQELLAGIELHPGQEFLLLNLDEADGITQTELAERLCVQPATLTRMIDRMEKAGFVERRPDPDDQRVSRVFKTNAAGELIEPIARLWSDLEAISFGNLTIEERILLRRLLLQVYDNLS